MGNDGRTTEVCLKALEVVVISHHELLVLEIYAD